MAFIVHTLTNIGATMLASATAGNKLRIIGCALSNTQYSLAEAQQLSTVPDAPATTRISVASVDNRVEARATFLREQGDQTGGNWYSMILIGRIGIVAARPLAVIVSDSQFYIPEVDSSISDVSVIFSLGFNIDINTILVPTETIYALNSELSALRDVAVTTHSINDSSVGDDQDIKGNKYFVRAIGTDAGLTTAGSIISGTEWIVRSSVFNEGIDEFSHTIAEFYDKTNNDIHVGLYLENDMNNDTKLTCEAGSVYFPALCPYGVDSVPIGAILMVALFSPTTPILNNLAAGRMVNHVNGVLIINPVKYNPTTHEFERISETEYTSMKFRLMTSCSLVQMGTAICMAMRVE